MFKTKRAFRLTLRGVLVTFGLVSGYAITILVDKKMYGWSATAFALLWVATIVEFVLGDYLAEKRYPYETEKKLRMLEERLGGNVVQEAKDKIRRTIDTFRVCDRSKVSGTLHIIVDLQPTAESAVRYGLMQLTDYVGNQTGGKGRITTLEKGVIGRCARTELRECVNFGSRSEYFLKMVGEFGFSKREAKSHTTAARSYLAQPLVRDGDTIGVLYFVSTEPQTFPLAAKEVQLVSVAQDLVSLLKAVSII
jgi:hypothetical protein